ncbi:MAG: hypothetical protein GY910_17515 [bacterium]|nr:hypothetical protein [bacterium]
MNRFKFALSGIATAILITSFALVLMPAESHAIARSMVGSLGVINPSVATPRHFERGPLVLGKKVGPHAPDHGIGSAIAAGATTGTTVGRTVTLPAGNFVFDGHQFRDFSAFPSVAMVDFGYSTSQATQATFVPGGGALANCPGPGCTATPLTATANFPGTAISWCPPNNNPVGNPAPGTVAAQVGNWRCSTWGSPGTGNHGVRLHIEKNQNAASPLKFGGSLSLIRAASGDTWRVVGDPSTPLASDATVARSLMVDTKPWTAGGGLGPNFGYVTNPAALGPRIKARLNAVGAVAETFGCAAPNSAGSVAPGVPGGSPGAGVLFTPGNPVGGVGVSCGTPTANTVPGQGFGFKMTTGFISGSDFFPGGRMTTANGLNGASPFNPVFAPAGLFTMPTASGGTMMMPIPPFVFTRQGGDTVSGTGTTAARNLVLLGGGIAADPSSGNLFFRLTDLRMTLHAVPEPASGAAIVAGVAGLAALARVSRRARK